MSVTEDEMTSSFVADSTYVTFETSLRGLIKDGSPEKYDDEEADNGTESIAA